MVYRTPFALILLACCAFEHVFAQPPVERETPLSPAQSLAQIKIDSGFQVRLMAHEPQVVDPVDAAFDDRGRLWVVEMRDYPFRTADVATGRIVVLTDADADGFFESSQVFADQLEMPTGIAIWKDGVVVTLAGQFVWMRDTDGDLKVNTQQVWLEGFSRDNEQLRANHPRLGPDGKWYIASGLRGGNVILGAEFRTGDAEPLTLGSRDVRFDPAAKQLEPITGPAQFGLCFDTLGHRLFCSNRNPAVMVRFEQQDLNGNPLAGLIPSVIDVIPSGEQSHVYPIVDAWTTSNLHAGQFTAACGVFYHEFDGEQVSSANAMQLPAVRLFACEPTGSLIHSSVFSPSVLPGLRVEPAEDNKSPREWLASRDAWFRPVNILASPDNGIVVLDMHRAVIEHPAWVPEELKNRRDERWGNSSGRVFHVAALGKDNLAVMLAELRDRPLGQRTSRELSQLVASPNAWMRDTARRLLLERGALEVIEALEKQALDADLPIAGRITSLSLAGAMQGKSPPVAEELISTPEINAEMQIAALRSLTLSSTTNGELLVKIEKLATNTTNREVLLECLRCLGTAPIKSADAAALVAVLEAAFAVQDGAAAELLIAAGSALRNEPQLLLSAWLAGISQIQAKSQPVEQNYVAAAAQRLTAAALNKDASTAMKLLQLARKHIGSSNTSAKSAAMSILGELTGSREKLIALRSALDAAEIWEQVLATAMNRETPAVLMQQAILLLPRSPRISDREVLPGLAISAETQIRVAAVRAWAATNDPACDEFLLQSIVTSSPQLKPTIIDLIGQHPTRIAALANRLAAGQFTAQQIGAIELKKLVTRAKDDIKQQLSAALESILNSNRAKVVADYQPCLAMSADALRGKQIFVKHCASCHRIADVGVQVGPDISDSRTQQPSQLLTNILDPNRAIDNNYFRFIALTEDDQVIEGMIAEETSDTVILRGQNNTRHVLSRSSLQELKATGVSLMPEGLEAQVDHQGMADLIAFIKGWRYMASPD